MSVKEVASASSIERPPTISRKLLRRRTSSESECALPSSSSKKLPAPAAALVPSSKAGMVPALLQDEQEELSKWPVKNAPGPPDPGLAPVHGPIQAKDPPEIHG